MILKTIAALVAVGTMVGAGWGANKYLATKDELMLAEAKIERVKAQTDYTMDRQMFAVLRDINRLEEKKNKTPDDLEQLRFLREQLKEMREVRKGK